MSFTVIIPARYASSRLPGKPLLDILGKPMVIRVLQQASASGAERVIVATDNQQVAEVVLAVGGEVCLTDPNHQSGTERLAEVVENYQFSDDTVIVNVQGDEPLIPPAIIQQVAKNLTNVEAEIATLAVPILSVDQAFDTNTVKVVTDKQGFALYFSRATIPWDREHFTSTPQQLPQPLLRHIGIYAYRAGFIRRYVALETCALEKIELLEQLRVLWYGAKIHVAVACESPEGGVDTIADLERVRRAFNSAQLG